jgi:hypothetical protein
MLSDGATKRRERIDPEHLERRERDIDELLDGALSDPSEA